MVSKKQDKPLMVVILAAGKGKRMKSSLPKVLHKLNGKELLAYVVDLAKKLDSLKTVIVVGKGGDIVRKGFSSDDLIFVEQSPQLGTGHALICASKEFIGLKGDVLVLYGDVPLISLSTIESLIHTHRQSSKKVTMLTAILDEPASYGRVIRDGGGSVIAVVEAGDATAEQRGIREINSGIYCFDSDFLEESLPRLERNNLQKEYYLTDLMGIAVKRGYRVGTEKVKDITEIQGINTIEELKGMEKMFKDYVISVEY